MNAKANTPDAELDMQTESIRSTVARLERKVDKLTEVISKLVLFEERQLNQSKDISEMIADNKIVISRLDALEDKVNKWIQRGVGAWAVVLIAAFLIELLFRFKGA